MFQREGRQAVEKRPASRLLSIIERPDVAAGSDKNVKARANLC